MMTAKELGGIIRETRKAQGMTQPQLAMACGTGIRFIVDLEAGKETCQLGKALLVAQMLGLNVGITGQNMTAAAAASRRATTSSPPCSGLPSRPPRP